MRGAPCARGPSRRPRCGRARRPGRGAVRRGAASRGLASGSSRRRPAPRPGGGRAQGAAPTQRARTGSRPTRAGPWTTGARPRRSGRRREPRGATGRGRARALDVRWGRARSARAGRWPPSATSQSIAGCTISRSVPPCPKGPNQDASPPSPRAMAKEAAGPRRPKPRPRIGPRRVRPTATARRLKTRKGQEREGAVDARRRQPHEAPRPQRRFRPGGAARGAPRRARTSSTPPRPLRRPIPNRDAVKSAAVSGVVPRSLMAFAPMP